MLYNRSSWLYGIYLGYNVDNSRLIPSCHFQCESIYLYVYLRSATQWINIALCCKIRCSLFSIDVFNATTAYSRENADKGYTMHESFSRNIEAKAEQKKEIPNLYFHAKFAYLSHPFSQNDNRFSILKYQ